MEGKERVEKECAEIAAIRPDIMTTLKTSKFYIVHDNYNDYDGDGDNYDWDWDWDQEQNQQR